jgi:hypothetical protein
VFVIDLPWLLSTLSNSNGGDLLGSRQGARTLLPNGGSTIFPTAATCDCSAQGCSLIAQCDPLDLQTCNSALRVKPMPNALTQGIWLAYHAHPEVPQSDTNRPSFGGSITPATSSRVSPCRLNLGRLFPWAPSSQCPRHQSNYTLSNTSGAPPG